MQQIRNNLKLVLELTKARIAVLSTMSAAAGYLAGGGEPGGLFAPVAGVFLLATGSLAFNQYQEREMDALMPRTSGRPLPSGRMKPAAALALSLALLACGLVVLLGAGGTAATALGAFTVLWYNGVYTPLKLRTAFAAVPGSLIGAVPPLIGYVSAGGSVLDAPALALALFFFIWQIPHFWLLLFRLGDQYRGTQIRSLTSVFTPDQLTRVTFVWIAASAVSCLFLPLFGAIRSGPAACGMLAAATWLVWRSSGLLRRDATDRGYRAAFVSINIYALIVVAVLSADRLLERTWQIR